MADRFARRIKALQFWRRDQCAHYRQVFGDPLKEPTRSQAAVLHDLSTFCFAERRTAVPGSAHIDPIAMAIAEGKRQVWLHLRWYLDLTDERMERINRMELQQRANIETRADEDDHAA